MRYRPFTSLALLSALVLAASALPGVAAAQSPGNPFAPVPQAQATVPTTTVPQTSTIPLTSTTGSSGGGGLSSGVAILIAIVAAALIGGISFYIWRDARRHAPTRHRAAAATAGAGGRTASKPRQKPRKLSPAERRRRKRGRAR